MEDRPRSGRPKLRADRVHMVQSIMEDLVTESSTGTSSVREAKRRMRIPEQSIRGIPHEMLDLHLHKIQVLRQLLSADTGARQKFATWVLVQMKRNLQSFLNVM